MGAGEGRELQLPTKPNERVSKIMNANQCKSNFAAGALPGVTTSIISSLTATFRPCRCSALRCLDERSSRAAANENAGRYHEPRLAGNSEANLASRIVAAFIA